MSPAYKVYRHGFNILSAETLPDGKHQIVHGEVEIPIEVNGRKLTIHVDEAISHRRRALQAAYCAAGQLRELKLSGVADIALTLPPEGKNPAETLGGLWIYSHYGEGRELSIEWHKKSFFAAKSKERE